MHSINENAERSAAFFNHASLGILVINGKGEIISVNPFLLKMFGYSSEEVIGNKIELLIPARYKKQHVNHREQYIHHPKSRPMGIGMDLFAVRKDGVEFPVEVSLGNYTEGDEHFVIGFVNDISIRKKAEDEIEKLNADLERTVESRTAELKKTLTELEFTNEKLETALSFQKAILNNAGVMLIVVDKDGIIRFFNPEASHLTGYSEADLLDKHTPVIFHLQSEIDQKRRQLEEEFGHVLPDDFLVLTEKARHNILEEVEYTYVRKDGTEFPVSLTVTAIRDKNGLITGFMGVAIDISVRKHAEADLLESLQKEKELSELKSRFVSMASHEFRTPLSTVLSSAYLVEKYTTTEEQSKREKHIHRIISSVNMLTDILNDFLSVGKIEEGKIQVRLTDFSISKVVGSVVQEMQGTAKKGQVVNYRHEGNEQVNLDSSLLKHVVMNLVSNAIKFSPENAPIDVFTAVETGKITLSVKDSGIGISMEDQEHLMERFFRGSNATNIQGTGLGLHIVSKYAELMNGTVICNSELEKGTTFTVSFNTLN